MPEPIWMAALRTLAYSQRTEAVNVRKVATAAVAEIEQLRESNELKEQERLACAAEVERLQREKQARIYYQNIVYDVCTTLDAIERRNIRHGKGIVCGTLETPEAEVQEAIQRIKDVLGADRKPVMRKPGVPSRQQVYKILKAHSLKLQSGEVEEKEDK